MPGIFDGTDKEKTERCGGDYNNLRAVESSDANVNAEVLDVENQENQRERTQTDVLNNHLLKSLLQRMNCNAMDQFADQGIANNRQDEEFL